MDIGCASANQLMASPRRLSNRRSGRVKDKVPSSNAGARAARLNHQASLRRSAMLKTGDTIEHYTPSL